MERSSTQPTTTTSRPSLVENDSMAGRRHCRPRGRWDSPVSPGLRPGRRQGRPEQRRPRHPDRVASGRTQRARQDRRCSRAQLAQGAALDRDAAGGPARARRRDRRGCDQSSRRRVASGQLDHPEPDAAALKENLELVVDSGWVTQEEVCAGCDRRARFRLVRDGRRPLSSHQRLRPRVRPRAQGAFDPRAGGPRWLRPGDAAPRHPGRSEPRAPPSIAGCSRRRRSISVCSAWWPRWSSSRSSSTS